MKEEKKNEVKEEVTEVKAEVKQEQPKGESNGLNIAALVLGIIAIVLAFIPFVRYVSYVLGPIGLILGIVALTKKQKREMAIVAIVLAIVSLVVVGIAQYRFNKNLKNFGKALEGLGQELSDAFADKTEEILANDLEVTIGDFTVDEEGWYTNTKLTVTLKNKSKKEQSFSINVEALDSNGDRIDTAYTSVSSLAPGQSETKELFTWVADDKLPSMQTATFKVYTASSY